MGGAIMGSMVDPLSGGLVSLPSAVQLTAAGVALAQPYRPVVATRFNMLNQGLSDGVKTSETYQSSHNIASLAGSIRDLRPYWENRSYTSNAEVPGPNDITITASIVVAGVIVPFRFNGSLSCVLKPGDGVFPDALPPVVQVLVASQAFFIRTCVTVAAGQKWPLGMTTYPALGEGNNNNGGDATLSGNVPTAFAFAYTPTGFVGISKAGRTFWIIGDSIGTGQANSISDKGYIEEGLDGRYGVVKTTKPGDTANEFSQLLYSLRRRGLAYFSSPSEVFIQHGVNDLNQGRTFEQLKGAITNIIKDARSVGVKVIHGCTLTPLATSSNGFIDLAGQTLRAAAPQRQLYNAWLRSGADGLIDRVCDAAAGVEVGGAAAPTGFWITNGTAGWSTDDGIHPKTAMYSGPLKQAVQLSLG